MGEKINIFIIKVYQAVLGLSFLSVYLTRGEKTQWAIVPAVIFLILFLVGAAEYYTAISSWPLIIIFLGIYLVYKNYKK